MDDTQAKKGLLSEDTEGFFFNFSAYILNGNR